MQRSIILPGDFEYEVTLATIPPDWKQVAEKQGNYAFVVDPNSGIARAVGGNEFREYLLGGEYEERLATMGYNPDEVAFTDEELEGVDVFYVDY